MGKRDRDVRHKKACVIGAGPNGLSAAIVLAQAGLRVDVFEAEAQPGGGARTMELTLPGFHHDFGSAVHPMAVGSPFFNSLPLTDYGLEWIYSPAPLAHPFDDGTAVTLERNFKDAERVLQQDGRAWCSLMAPLAKNWPAFAKDVLQPLLRFPSHPFLLANFAQDALAPATFVARRRFRNERTRALFAGLAAHSFLSLNEPLSASFGMVLGAAAHAVGWPIPRGGAQAITNALSAHLVRLGGKIIPSSRVDNLEQVRKYDVVLCDITPRQLLHLSQGKLSPGYRKRMEEFRYGPGIFKVDYALSSPIPWKSADCLRAQPCTWAEAWRKLPRQKPQWQAARLPSGRSCCWRSRRYSISHAHLLGSTLHGPIVTFPTVLRAICCRESKRRSSASLPGFAIASWRGALLLRQICNPWMPT